MGNRSRQQKSTRKKTRVDSIKKYRRPVKSTKDNTRKKRPDQNQNNTSGKASLNYTRLLQLFPYLHPVAIDRIFANCNRDFIRTIDNLLYIKRYLYFAQTNDSHPQHTATATTDPNCVFVHQSDATENEQNRTNTRTTDMQQDNSSNNNDVDDVVNDGDGYIPNGNIEGIREQLRMYKEEQCSLGELDSDVHIFPSSQCTSSVDCNFHTSTPQLRLHSASAGDDVNIRLLGLTNYFSPMTLS